MVDNTAAVYIINNMGTSHSDICHGITIEIWEFCIKNQIYLPAAHLPGSINVVADKESRTFYRGGVDVKLTISPIRTQNT